MTTTPATPPQEPAVAPDLRERPEVHTTRQDLHRMMERMVAAGSDGEDAEGPAFLREVLALLEQDPTLALRGETARLMDLIGELARQLPPLRRRAARDPGAEQDLARVRERLRTHVQRLREQARPDWHAPHQRRALALERMPAPEETARSLAQAAGLLRSSVEGALEIDPGLAAARRLLDLADRIGAAADENRG